MRFFTALSLAFLAAGCGLLDRLQNNVILVATLLQSPAVPAGLPGVSGSSAVLANVYLGQKSGDITSPPSEQTLSAIHSATVTLKDTPPAGSAVTTTLYEVGTTGNYQPTSSVTYTPGHTYRFTATVGSDQYWGEVAIVPPAPNITLPAGTPGSPSGVYTYTSYGTLNTSYGLSGFPIDRGGTDVAFYGVWPVTTTFTSDATPNCGNIPKTAGEILNLLFLDKSSYTKNPFLPNFGTCFPPPGPGTYVVGVTSVKQGTTSDNVSFYSAALAGSSAAVGVAITAP